MCQSPPVARCLQIWEGDSAVSVACVRACVRAGWGRECLPQRSMDGAGAGAGLGIRSDPSSMAGTPSLAAALQHQGLGLGRDFPQSREQGEQGGCYRKRQKGSEESSTVPGWWPLASWQQLPRLPMAMMCDRLLPVPVPVPGRRSLAQGSFGEMSVGESITRRMECLENA